MGAAAVLGLPVLRLTGNRSRLSVTSKAFADAVAEAWLHYPFETGGVMLGRVGARGVVASISVGAGPNATRDRTRFSPDQPWQAAQVALACAADPTLQYLGDWHTHPDGPARLSPRDENVLRLIAGYPQARQPQPWMVVLALTASGAVRPHAANFVNGRPGRGSLEIVHTQPSRTGLGATHPPGR